MGNINGPNILVNGVGLQASNMIKLDASVSQSQVIAAAGDNNTDEIMLHDPTSGEYFMAYGQDMDFGGLDGYQPGQQVSVLMNGKQMEIIPFMDENTGTQLLFDDELNSASDGATEALGFAKDFGQKAIGMTVDNAAGAATALMTVGALARLGGAKMGQAATQEALKSAAASFGATIAKEGGEEAAKAFGQAAAKTIAEAGTTTGSKSFMSRAGSFLFGPAQGLAPDVARGVGKTAKWTGIVLGTAAVVGIGGTAIYGATRESDTSAIEQLGQKVY